MDVTCRLKRKPFSTYSKPQTCDIYPNCDEHWQHFTHIDRSLCVLFNVHLYTDRLHYGYCWNDVLVLVVSHATGGFDLYITQAQRLDSTRFDSDKQIYIYFYTHREKENKESVSDECQELEISKQ